MPFPGDSDAELPLDPFISSDDEGEEEEESFAVHFYRSGTDCSSLLMSSYEEGALDSKNNKQLKQRNLLDMWGLKLNKNNNAPPSPPLKRLKRESKTTLSLSSTITTNPPSCPFYKRIPGTPFVVDAFRYGSVKDCCGYFLTHFHSDHYAGLTKGWHHGPIYCSPLTARLLALSLSLNSSFIQPLQFNVEYVIQGVNVMLLDANHCPGAALIHFALPNGKCYLHTGDFRASKLMQTYPLLLKKRINVLYLDTTYCNPNYQFPPKEDVLSFVVGVTKDFLRQQPKTLVIVGAYSIGKECVYLAISKALGVKIYASSSRRRILQSFGWPDLSQSLCTQAKDTPLHVLPISFLRFENLENYLKSYANQYGKVLAFRPTGWTYSQTIGKQLDRIRPSSKGNVTVYGVPYSEHSSFIELREFVEFMKPDKIIPTVNVGNPASREKMQAYFREWLKE